MTNLANLYRSLDNLSGCILATDLFLSWPEVLNVGER